VIYLRSLLFNLVFYLASIVIVLAALPLFLLPRGVTAWGMRQWARVALWLLKVCAGTQFEIIGKENLPEGPALIACKHLSMWDTIVFLAILDDPAMVLKRELLLVPFYGWYAVKGEMIAIDRAAGATALRRLVQRGRKALSRNRSIVIFPEGTRAKVGDRVPYKPGVAALYRQLRVPCIPAAHNSGLYWSQKGFIRRPGTITLSFLPAIEPGLDRATFMARLEGAIETETTRLIQAAPESFRRFENAAD